MDVIVLAGGRCSEELRAASGVDHRAEITVGGKRLVDTVLYAAGGVGCPILVGGPQMASVDQVPAGENFCQSLANGLAATNSDTVLIVTVDLPCLTTDSLNRFLTQCDQNAGFNFPIISKATCEKAFPGMRRTTLKLREGEFTGGNVALVSRKTMLSALPTIERAYQLRKKPLALAGLIGYGTLLKVALGQLAPHLLPLASLESAVGAFLGTTVRAIQSEDAELGADLDRAEHLAAFESLMKSP